MSDKSFAVGEANYSVAVWLKLHEVEPNKIFDFNSDEDCQLLKRIIYQEDEVYLTKLQQLVEKVDDTADGLAQIKSLLAGWQSLKRWGDGIPSLSDLEEVEVEINEETKIDVEETVASDSNQNLLEEEFSFVFETINSSVEVINHETKTNRQLVFDLGGIKLEMVYIPGGSFLMGAPETDANHKNSETNESKPQHEVKIGSFYMSKFPITMEQYELVMGLIDNSLKKNSYRSYHDAEFLSCVNYIDARNFCLELSGKLGKTFQLPSEAQWEYACRAGTTTPYYFGDIGSVKSEKINDIESWLFSATPNFRNELICQEISRPNAFGLHNMVGKIYQWCEDYWHDNYQDAPNDGSAWNTQSCFYRKVKRGFSSSYIATKYSSHYRQSEHSLCRDEETGFRVTLANIL